MRNAIKYLNVLFISCVFLTGCAHTGIFPNLGSHYVVNTGLEKRNLETVKSNAVLDGQASWVLLKRVYLTDVGSWIGSREVTVGVTITYGSSGNRQIGKGVVGVDQVVNNTCLQFRNRQAIDPFIFRRGSYRIALDIVELPAKNAALLASLAKTVVGTASISSPIMNIGSALYDTFIQPEINNKTSLVHYEQDFEAIEMRNNVDDLEIPWQKGTIVFLPRDGQKYTVDNKTISYQIDPSKLYVDQGGDLRVGNPAAHNADDAYFKEAPYIIMEVAANWRGYSQADEEVSSVLKTTARKYSNIKNNGGKEIDDSINDIKISYSKNSSLLTDWTQSMVIMAIQDMQDAKDAIAIKEDDDKKLIALKAALVEHNGFITKYKEGLSVAALTSSELDALQFIEIALTKEIEPLKLSVQNRKLKAETSLAIIKARLMDEIKKAQTPTWSARSSLNGIIDEYEKTLTEYAQLSELEK
jgi:hypothetical protein